MVWYYWLSFADPNLPPGKQFLGVSIVKTLSQNVVEAVGVAHIKKCNPGGEVQGYLLRFCPEIYLNHLYTDKHVLQEIGSKCIPYHENEEN